MDQSHIIYELISLILEFSRDRESINLLKTCKKYYNDCEFYKIKSIHYNCSDLVDTKCNYDTCNINTRSEFELYRDNANKKIKTIIFFKLRNVQYISGFAEGLENIVISGCADDVISIKVPSTVKKINMEQNRVTLLNIPHNLEVMVCSNISNNQIDSMRKTIKKLELQCYTGDNYHYLINGIFNELEYLSLGILQITVDVILPKLKTLELYGIHSKKILAGIDGVKENDVELDLCYNDDFDDGIYYLPNFVSRLYISDHHGTEKDIITIKSKNLKHLKYDNNMKFILETPQLEELFFYHSFDKEISKLPDSLTAIDLSTSLHNSKLDFSKQLKKIRLGDNYNHEITYYPETLEMLILGDRYYKNIDHIRVKQLFLGKNYSHHLNLWDGLEVLGIHNCYRKKIKNIPKNLKRVYLVVPTKRKYINNYPCYVKQEFQIKKSIQDAFGKYILVVYDEYDENIFGFNW